MVVNFPFSKSSLFSDKKALDFYVNNTSDVVVVIDSRSKIKYVNKTFALLMACDAQILIGRNINELLNDQNKKKFALFIESEGDESFKIELAINATNGAEKWFNFRLHHYRGGIVLVGKDETEEKVKIAERSEEVKKNEEERIRSQEILENIGDGVVSVNDKGEIIFVNHQAIDILGFQAEELIGELVWRKIIMIGVNGEEIGVEKRPIRMALFSRKRIYENSQYYKTKDGRFIPVAITATPLVVHDLVIGGVDVFRDITKEREVDRMKTEFISLASHQLRTPLSATKWFAELLLDDDKDFNSEQIDLINNIYKSNQRMIDLVNALLNISRIESGRIIIEPKLTDLRKLVEDVIFELTPKIKEKKHNVILSIHEDLPMISIDAKLIRNVYMNLLTNSIKYTKENGEIVIMISKKENEIISQVSDNGLGIPENQKQRIFEKFFRSSNIIKVETDGTGLGLYLAKAIVESSGGKMWFESEEYKGTTFWFTLPLSGSPAKKGEISLNS